MSIKYTTDSFAKKLYGVNPNISILGEYRKSNVGILCQCNICGHQWSPTPNKLLQGRGCPVCANTRRGIRKDVDSFKKELAEKNPTVSLNGTFIKGHAKTSFRCKVCGNVWDAAPYSILAGHGCPKCYRASTSFAEQFIFESLQQLLPRTTILNRDRRHIGKELDIYIPDFKLAIEFNGWKWHSNSINKDAEKVNLCKQHQITIIQIYDSCPLDITHNKTLIMIQLGSCFFCTPPCSKIP